MFLSYLLLLFVTTVNSRSCWPKIHKACSTSTTPACSCPTGTTLQQSTTKALMKADVSDVMEVMGSYQNTTWFLHSPDYITGPDNAVGSSRTLTGSTPAGTAQFTETLFDYTSDRHGFKMSYFLENDPITYMDPATSQEGAYAGYWDFLTVRRVRHGTFIKWAIYACFTPDELSGMKKFHELALENVNSVLEDQGLSQGFPHGLQTVELFLD